MEKVINNTMLHNRDPHPVLHIRGSDPDIGGGGDEQHGLFQSEDVMSV